MSNIRITLTNTCNTHFNINKEENTIISVQRIVDSQLITLRVETSITSLKVEASVTSLEYYSLLQKEAFLLLSEILTSP